MASDITKDLGKMKAKKKKADEKKNNSVIWHSYKHFLVRLFLNLLNQELPQYIWTLVPY